MTWGGFTSVQRELIGLGFRENFEVTLEAEVTRGLLNVVWIWGGGTVEVLAGNT